MRYEILEQRSIRMGKHWGRSAALKNKTSLEIHFCSSSRSNGAPKFSDIVNSGDKKDLLTRRITSSKKKSVVFRPGDILRRDEDAKPTDDRTTRSDSSSAKESDDGTSSPDRPASDTHSNSDDAYSDVLQTADSGIGEDIHDGHISIFERPDSAPSPSGTPSSTSPGWTTTPQGLQQESGARQELWQGVCHQRQHRQCQQFGEEAHHVGGRVRGV
ncbi:hypothetical protein CEXT_163901 [Caerostris extrusa]|uniref:Uncharacterized protein n=1 Tax=Caerostris extrusa TaxID=172846 RepID=A0AAV4T1C6_CAEEX|nr:hypothetical protein CEXT_163901 [Caerostris extrusa]